MQPKQPQPLILTLQLDAKSFASFDDLRRRHFPPERNVVPAHITLFHALPGEGEQEIATVLSRVCSQTPALGLCFSGVRFLGGGVAITVESPGLLALRKRLGSAWDRWLGAQDRAGFWPHITIQNKVSAMQARHLFEHISRTWQPFAGRGEGLRLWHYRGGPWELARAFSFQQPDPLI